MKSKLIDGFIRWNFVLDGKEYLKQISIDDFMNEEKRKDFIEITKYSILMTKGVKWHPRITDEDIKKYRDKAPMS